jgi:hypothetical protein
MSLVGETLDGDDRDFGPPLSELVARIEHLDGTKAELKGALAYVAAQVHAYRRIANEDAALAIRNIKSTVDSYYERRAK